MRGSPQLRRKSRSIHAFLALVAAFLSIGATSVSAIQSDDFSSTTLDTSLWTLVDPVGDATMVLTGTNLLMDIPGGTSHDLWVNANLAPRLTQLAADTDFEIEGKFDSIVERRFQLQGFIVGDDFDTFLRFDTYYNGSSVVFLAAFINGGSANTHISTTIAGTPSYRRVKRTGDSWEYSYSFDGVNWTLGGTFLQAMTVNEVGIFVGASDGTIPPPHVGNIDYFFDRSSPIIPEDGGNPTAPSPPIVEVWYGDNQNFGQMGNPQSLIQVMGRVWDTDELDSLSFTLNGGPSIPLTIGTDGLRLVRDGDYNLEIDNTDLQSGANTVVITALDTLGE